MIKSMTGYGRTESTETATTITAEVKSVNHKNMEVVVRLPNGLSPLEVTIRRVIQEEIVRGRVEVAIRIERTADESTACQVTPNLPLAKSYNKALEAIQRELGIKGDITLSMIAGMRDILLVAEEDIDIEEIWPSVEKVLRAALAALSQMREQEGAALESEFAHRLDSIESHVGFLRTRTPEIVSEYRTKLASRVKELTDGLLMDEDRLNQEVAIMAEKSDITEELVRLESHLAQFRTMLHDGGPLGRKLDFLLQEMHREVNTLGSKSSDSGISYHVIEMKTEISKLREQVQNVE